MTSGDYEKPILPPGFKPGRSRPFFSTVPSPAIVQRSILNQIDHFLIFLLLALGVLIRLYKLPLPSQVVFDEVHFGGFAREYYRGEFYLDVHPPLAKLMYYWIALLFGWDGKFEFAQIGDLFDRNVPYIWMRLFPAICGILTVVLTFGILRASNCRSIVAFFGAFLVLIENSLVTQSRFILLDSPLIFGIALTVYGFKKFQLTIPFTRKWFKFLVLTGLGLGITSSIKFTGLFTVSWVGILTIIQLWYYLGDLDVSNRKWFIHVLIRVFGLILLPITIYLGFFAVHFASLPFSGSGSGAVSPNFKSTFADSQGMLSMPVEVSYGSTVTIKHNSLEGYLHSHDSNYKSGSKEQQVTVYGFTPDINNEWIIETKNKNREGQLQKKFRPVKDGEIIRLYHKNTGKYLHVNDVRPPISEHDYSNEVSCSGSRETLGDVNYEFKVRIVSKNPHSKSDLPLIKLRATESVFQLVHQGTKCIVMSHKDKLPDWGYNQNEVLCVDEPTIPNTLWYIEYNSHPLLDNDIEHHERVKFKPFTFWNKVVEYHKAMFRINSGLTNTHTYASTPETWPFLLRGINYFSNDAGTGNKLTDESGSHIYLLGNLAIYYIGFFLLTLVLAKQSFYLLKHLNPFSIPTESISTTIFYANSFEFILGWVLHYFPSFSMSRQLFLHHYLSPLYFSILLIAQFIEYVISKRKYVGYILMILIASLAAFCFFKFTPIIYGIDWSRSACNHSKWFPTWDFNCMTYTH